jgi:hypothetical protein
MPGRPSRRGLFSSLKIRCLFFWGLSLFAWTLAHLCASLFMTGVIWFVHRALPAFANIGCGEFAEYERRHANLTGYVVARVMLFELATSFVVAYLARQATNVTLGYAALGRGGVALHLRIASPLSQSAQQGLLVRCAHPTGAHQLAPNPPIDRSHRGTACTPTADRALEAGHQPYRRHHVLLTPQR